MWTARILAVSGVMALAGIATSAPINSSPACTSLLQAKSDEGVVKSVDTSAKSFVLTVSGKDMTMKFDDKTTYMLDGKASTRDKVLVTGKKVKVAHTGDLATSVDGTTPKVP